MSRVSISLGAIEGMSSDGVHRFLGVPYAEPITVVRRFMPPLPKSSWHGVLDAQWYGATCIQTPMAGLFGQLSPDPSLAGPDCLNLNIWTPDPDASLPVMVWIHGGAFFAGTGNDEFYKGDAFARSGVVVVAINYRLGAQGFLELSHFGEAYESSGCVGIMDQVCALEWVRRHISKFGGDPNRVTIAGESAGAMSVATLLTVPSARGLFQRAIAQSGAANNSMPRTLAQIVTRELLSRLKIHDSSELKTVSDQQLVEAQAELMQEIETSQDVDRFGLLTGSPMIFQPVHGCAFLPEHPSIALAKGAAGDVALLQGVTRHEAPIFFYDLVEVLDDVLAQQVCAPIAQAAGLDIEIVHHHYLAQDAPPLAKVGAFMSDFMFNIPTADMLSAQALYNPHVWAYRFDWENPSFEGVLQAHHFIEVPFVFQTPNSGAAKTFGLDKVPERLMNIVHNAWVSFVTNGDPNHQDLPHWPTWQGDGLRPCMCLNETCLVDTFIDADTLAIWGVGT